MDNILKIETLIFLFFKQFSSFESALRIKGFINQDATIRWDNIKNELAKNKFLFTETQKRFEIVKNPPKQLRFIKDTNELHWELGNICNEDHDIAINALVRVRNNLFHGSKRFDSSEGERNVALLSEALTILGEVIKCLKIEDIYRDVLDYWNAEVIR